MAFSRAVSGHVVLARKGAASRECGFGRLLPGFASCMACSRAPEAQTPGTQAINGLDRRFFIH